MSQDEPKDAQHFSPRERWAMGSREVAFWFLFTLIAVGVVVWLIADLAMAAIAVAVIGLVVIGVGLGITRERTSRGG